MYSLSKVQKEIKQTKACKELFVLISQDYTTGKWSCAVI